MAPAFLSREILIDGMCLGSSSQAMDVFSVIIRRSAPAKMEALQRNVLRYYSSTYHDRPGEAAGKVRRLSASESQGNTQAVGLAGAPHISERSADCKPAAPASSTTVRLLISQISGDQGWKLLVAGFVGHTR